MSKPPESLFQENERHIQEIKKLWKAMGEMRQCYFEVDHPDFTPPEEDET